MPSGGLSPQQKWCVLIAGSNRGTIYEKMSFNFPKLSDYVMGAEVERSEVEGVGSTIEDFQALDTLLKVREGFEE